MTNKVQKIREEVERRYKTNLIGAHYAFRNGKCEALREVLEFIDSMQEEPVSEDLEEAAKRYATEGDETSGLYIIDEEVEAFKAGAKWQKQQMMKDAVEGIVYAKRTNREIMVRSHYFQSDKLDYNDKVKLILAKED